MRKLCGRDLVCASMHKIKVQKAHKLAFISSQRIMNEILRLVAQIVALCYFFKWAFNFLCTSLIFPWHVLDQNPDHWEEAYLAIDITWYNAQNILKLIDFEKNEYFHYFPIFKKARFVHFSLTSIRLKISCSYLYNS